MAKSISIDKVSAVTYGKETKDEEIRHFFNCPECKGLNDLKELPNKGDKLKCGHCKETIKVDG